MGIKHVFWKSRSLPFSGMSLACGLWFVAAHLIADTVIVPNYSVSNQVHASDGTFNTVLREQTVYRASEFPSYPIIISEIRLRPDQDAAGPISTTVSNLQIDLSTTQSRPDQLNLTFSQNIGTNDAVVFSGALNISTSFTTLTNGTKSFDIEIPLQTPFFYDPSQGNLLLDIRDFSGCSPGEVNFVNSAVASDATSRIFNLDPSADSASGGDTAGFALEVVYTLAAVPPTITSQPTNLTVNIGHTAMFSVLAEGPSPLNYQWFFNDITNPIGGATNGTLMLDNAQTNQSGIYFVQVSDPFSSTLSSNAVLEVTPAPVIVSGPENQTAEAGATATFEIMVDSSASLSYQWFFEDTNMIPGATNDSLSVTNVEIPELGTYSVQVSNIYGTVGSSDAVLTLGLIVPNYSASNQVHASDGTFNFALRQQVVYRASEFPPYPIVISEIRWRPDLDANGPISTTVPSLQVDLSTTQAKPDQLNSIFAENSGGDDTVVFKGALNILSSFTTLANATKAFDIKIPLQTSFLYDSSRGNLLLDIHNFAGCTPGEVNFVNLASSSSDSTSRIYNSSDPNGSSASGGDSGGYALEVGYTPAPLPPTILSQPTNQTVSAGRSATFSVTAAGPLTLSYQWFYNDASHPIDSATNSSFTLTNVQPSQVGIYFVEVTDAYGTTPSSNVALTVTTDPPSISSQPIAITTLKGTDVSFAVSADGSLPMTFQWFFNTNNSIPDATNSTLALKNVQLIQAGMYSVAVSNAYGFTNSVYARLTVTNLPAVIQLGTNGASLMGGYPVDIPVYLMANGNENTLEFSMNFNTQRMSYAGITLGSGAPDAALLPNTTQATNGRLGVTMQLPAGETFAPGTQEVVRVTLLSTPLTGTQSVVVPINFTNTPINKLLYDAQGNRLATNFVNDSVTITPTIFEADVTPRPGGDQSLDIFDWAQVGRFVAGLDIVTNSSEFQRADCAPKVTSGDGQLKVTDWVQAGRYAAAIDSPAAVGGPSAPVAPTILTGGPRTLTIANGTAVQGVPVTVPVTLQSQGNENALGFSLQFDPAVLKYAGVIKGSAASSATMDVNSNQVAAGTVGVLLALPAGNNFSSGAQEIAKVSFIALVSATNNSVSFADAPVLRAISDPLANELSANYSSGTLTINPPPVLGINLTDTNVLLSWPVWATGFSLQAAGESFTPAWTNFSGAPQTNGNNISVLVPLNDPGAFFRLQHP